MWELLIDYVDWIRMGYYYRCVGGVWGGVYSFSDKCEYFFVVYIFRLVLCFFFLLLYSLVLIFVIYVK